MANVKISDLTGAAATTAGQEFEVNDALTSKKVTASQVSSFVLSNLSSADLVTLGVTASAAELNTLDGVTSNTAELNILDGVTASTAEVNHLVGVTSPIQTQVDAKYTEVTQTTATWEAGTDTTESVISAAKVAAAVAALAPSSVATPFDVQAFTTTGTWTKPAEATAGDIVVVYVVGGGGAGAYTFGAGGGGGGGLIARSPISALGATEAVAIGAGASGSTSENPPDGGTTTFGTAGAAVAGVAPMYLEARGGEGAAGSTGGAGGLVFFGRNDNDQGASDNAAGYKGGTGANSNGGAFSSVFGAGGGGGVDVNNGGGGGHSAHAGRGGQGCDSSGGDLAVTSYEIDGTFPGGGGGSTATATTGKTRGGNGADGYCVIACFRGVYA